MLLAAVAGDLAVPAPSTALLAGIGFAGSSSLAVTVLVSRWFAHGATAVLPRVFLGINAGQLTLVPLGGAADRPGRLSRRPTSRSGCSCSPSSSRRGALRLDAPGASSASTRTAPAAPAAGRPAVRRPRRRAHRDSSGCSRWRSASTAGRCTSSLLHLPRLARDLGGGSGAGGGLLAIAAAASASRCSPPAGSPRRSASAASDRRAVRARGRRAGRRRDPGEHEQPLGGRRGRCSAPRRSR